MKAGEELDKLIFTKVMGESLEPLHHVSHEFNYDDYFEYPCIRCGLPEKEAEGKPCIEERFVLPYSTDIKFAWQVVEKLTTGGFALELEDGEKVELYFKLTYNWEEGYGCWAYFDWKQTADRHPLYGANAPTAPLAICLAALKAVKDEVG